MTSKRIVFFGNERLATGVTTKLPIVRSLHKAGFDIAAIIVTSQTSALSRKPRLLEIANFATENQIPLLAIDNLRDNIDKIKGYEADTAVLAAFGKIVPRAVIDIFRAGIINIHPSLLPKHRGPTPLESPILNGELETGVSLMQLVQQMDAGPVYDQVKYKLRPEQTKQKLADDLGELGAARLVELLPDIISGRIQPHEQLESEATYDSKIGPNDGMLDFSHPAFMLERQVRAYAGWPRSKTIINNQPVVITQAKVLELSTDNQPGVIWRDADRFGFITTDGILEVKQIIPAGSKEMSAADYLRGHSI